MFDSIIEHYDLSKNVARYDRLTSVFSENYNVHALILCINVDNRSCQ